MENKERYFNLLKQNNGQLNEADLGETMGLDADETQELITQLLSEHRIEYIASKNCNYKVIKKRKISR